MADGTGIEWTDATWNPIYGCSRVSEGCRHCYAERVAARFSGPGKPYEGLAHMVTRPDQSAEARWTGKVKLVEKHLLDPLRWKRPRRIFVNSMSDLFHESVPDEWIDRIFAVMALAPQHTFQILTKRPERMRDYCGGRAGDWQVVLPDANPPGSLPITKNDVERHLGRAIKFSSDPPTPSWPLPNVWLGTSVEDQATADGRLPHLLATPAAVRFVSAEPLLAAVDLRHVALDRPDIPNAHIDALAGYVDNNDIRRLDWVIVGGESGPGARPMHPDWVRTIRDQCAAAGTAFLFKQWGEWAPGECAQGPPTRTEHVAYWFNDRWHFDCLTPRASEETRHEDAPNLYRIGKKAAGRLLDGCIHDAMPETGR